MFQPILIKDISDLQEIEVYEREDGYQALRKALTMEPREILKIVDESGLKGRGGAGFPTGKKWSFVPAGHPGPKYLVCNADEGEPGTFKDRTLIQRNPHQLIEGMLITAHALGITHGFIFIRGEYALEGEILKRALQEATERGYLDSFKIDIYVGMGGYICGEETALLNTIEGRRPVPRMKPPFPQVKGLFGQPTIVNNVETLANIPPIIAKGALWFKSLGIENGAGTKLYCISGHVKRPGCYELPIGTSLREIVYEYGGGPLDGRTIKGVFPGGSSTPILTERELDCAMDFGEVEKVGSRLGSGGIIVIDDRTCIVKTALILSRFYSRESCGFCTPCREGLPWVTEILQGLEDGAGKGGDIGLLYELCDTIRGKSFCPLAWGAIDPVASSIEKFREEFEDHMKYKKCTVNS